MHNSFLFEGKEGGCLIFSAFKCLIQKQTLYIKTLYSLKEIKMSFGTYSDFVLSFRNDSCNSILDFCKVIILMSIIEMEHYFLLN